MTRAAAYVAVLLAAVVPSALGQTPANFSCTGETCEPIKCFEGYQCYNGGYCNPAHGEGNGVLDICLCPPGYAEAGCTTKVVHCPGGSWCTNGGTCGVGGSMCKCPIGFSGGRCQTQDEMDTCVGPLAGHYCLNGGMCDAGNTTDNACLCPDGYAGSSCEKRVTRCIGGNYCENGGTCSGSACVCPAGFTGGHCQILDRSGLVISQTAGGKGKGALADGDERLAVIVAVPLVFVVVGLGAFTLYLVQRERNGDPLFTKLDNVGGGGGNDRVDIEVTPVTRM